MSGIAVTDDYPAILARLRRLEDERDIRDLLVRYCASIDYGDEAAWVDCFTEDGRFEVRFHAPGKAIPLASDGEAPPDRATCQSGRDQLAAFIAGHSRPPAAFHKHVVLNIAIELGTNPDEAQARSVSVRVDDVDDRREIYAFGRCVDTLKRCADGKWRFRTRVVEIDSPAVPDGVDLVARSLARASRN